MQHWAEEDTSFIHIAFDFAEKVLLRSILRQPGQIYFITGLKFDIFEVASSSLDLNFIYGLPEGPWTGNKNCERSCLNCAS